MSSRIDPAFRPVSSGPGTQIRIDRRDILKGALASSAAALATPVLAATTPRPYSARIIQSGHSLTDPIIPALTAMVAAVGGLEAQKGVIDGSTVPGSPMEGRWENRRSIPPDARYDIANYDVLVNTERAPIQVTMTWHRSEEMALIWFEHAFKNGNDGKGADNVLYGTWVDIDSGPGFANPYNDPEGHLTFRQRLEPEMARWQTIVDYVNDRRPAGSAAMPLIPGPMIMAAVYDDIEAGKAPGLTAISDLFEDNIHLNDSGAYLIALAHFAVIYRRDPMIVPSRIGIRPGPLPETADWMKETVVRILRDYPDSGLGGVL
jgi:hypothetical protein